MNQWALNGQNLGNGVADPRTFMSMLGQAVTSSVAVIYARRYMVSATSALTSAAIRIDGIFQIRGAVTALTSSVITTGTYYAKYLNASVSVATSSSGFVYGLQYMVASVAAVTASVVIFWRGVTLSSSTLATTSSASFNIGETGFNAPSERTMIVPYEDRTMRGT